MTIKPNAYIVMDTETSGFSKLVFDFGWTTIDKRGNVLGSGDLNFLDVVATERPYFWNKVSGYAKRIRKGEHGMTSFAIGRRLFNLHVAHLIGQGYRPIVCAYNGTGEHRTRNHRRRRHRSRNRRTRQPRRGLRRHVRPRPRPRGHAERPATPHCQRHRRHRR